MAQQHQAQPFALPLPQAQSLLTHFTAFLTTALHTLLYHRNLYPPATFLTTRSHNLPVHQSRHPAVCSWIAAAVSSVRDQLLAGSVEKVVFVVHSPPSVPSAKTSSPADDALESQPELVVAVEEEEAEPRPGVVERWVFDVSSFPAFAGPGELDKKKQKKSDAKGKGKEREPDGGGCDEGEEEEVAEEEGSVNWVDVEEQFRGALGRISHAGEKLGALPKGCTFTVAVELRDDAPVPVEHPQAWIPSEPNLQPKRGADVGGKATPIRSVEAGPLFFECWIEEGSPNVKKLIDMSMAKEGPKGRGMPLA